MIPDTNFNDLNLIFTNENTEMNFLYKNILFFLASYPFDGYSTNKISPLKCNCIKNH